MKLQDDVKGIRRSHFYNAYNFEDNEHVDYNSRLTLGKGSIDGIDYRGGNRFGSMPLELEDEFETFLESGKAAPEEPARAAAKQLQHDVKTFVGTSIAVELKGEGGVERSQGKAKRVVDLRNLK